MTRVRLALSGATALSTVTWLLHIQRSIVESLTSELGLRYLELRRVIAVSNAGAQIFLWRVARPRLLLSPPVAASGCEYRCPLANEKSLAVSCLPFVHWASRTDASI